MLDPGAGGLLPPDSARLDLWVLGPKEGTILTRTQGIPARASGTHTVFVRTAQFDACMCARIEHDCMRARSRAHAHAPMRAGHLLVGCHHGRDADWAAALVRLPHHGHHLQCGVQEGAA